MLNSVEHENFYNLGARLHLLFQLFKRTVKNISENTLQKMGIRIGSVYQQYKYLIFYT